MSASLIVLIVAVAVLAVFFVGGLVRSRQRLANPALEGRIADADQALEQARASDRGWDRTLLEQAARRALAQERPDFGDVSRLQLVLVDDRPGVEEDRAHMTAVGSAGDEARIVLTRDSAGEWILERVE